MMTDEERRELARRLRMNQIAWTGMGWKMWLGPYFGNVVLSGSNKEIEDAAHQLADLIEPKPSCNRNALLELADEMDSCSRFFDGSEFADCLKQATDFGFEDYANIIREALGEE